MGDIGSYNTNWSFRGVSKMSMSDIPISDLFYIIPSDIKALLLVIFSFLVGLAVWRIIK